MKRSYIFRKPCDDDDEHYSGELVRAKPVSTNITRRLDGFGKSFVRSTDPQERHNVNQMREAESRKRELSNNDKNRIHAQILKAELRGDMDQVRALRRKLEGEEESQSSSDSRVEIMMKSTDKGMILPTSLKRFRDEVTSTADGKYKLNTIDQEYHVKQEIHEMVREEKTTTARDQLSMFNSTAKLASSSRTDDDWVVDDAMMSHKKKKRYDEKLEKMRRQEAIKEHSNRESTLSSCRFCVESSSFNQNIVIASGFQTCLSHTPWRPLVRGHLIITPNSHYVSTVDLDEDVFIEMRMWRKGLVAMWKDQGMDCLFVETAKDVKRYDHMYIECIPVPNSVAHLLPIYFKKAIDECESEYSDNKKLIDFREKHCDLRRTIPKNMSYFAVDFGNDPGFAHVIENGKLFPRNFAHEVVGGILDLEPNLWRNRPMLNPIELKMMRKEMIELWKPFDWTERAKTRAAALQ